MCQLFPGFPELSKLCRMTMALGLVGDSSPGGGRAVDRLMELTPYVSTTCSYSEPHWEPSAG